MTKEQEYANKIYSHITELFNDDCENKIDKDDFDSNENSSMFFHCLSTLAPAMLYNHLTGNDVDALEFNHIANRLTFQFSKIESE